MTNQHKSKYQPFLLRLLHNLTAISTILAIITAFWTYNVYDGRWFKIPLPYLQQIEGIHGTFGLWTILIFPFFVIYVCQKGQQGLISSNFVDNLQKIKSPLWWHNIHRFANTLILIGLTFAVFSGKMMDEKWLPQGELNHLWYYLHLTSWLIMVWAIFLHLLMGIKVGGIPLILSMVNLKYKAKDNPRLWGEKLINFKDNWQIVLKQSWQNLPPIFKFLQTSLLLIIFSAWLIPFFLL